MITDSLITRELALEILSGQKGVFLRRRKKILKAELLYLPVYLFNITTEDFRNKVHSQAVAVDGLLGEYAIYEAAETSDQAVNTHESISFQLDEQAARTIAESEFRRILLRHNMRNTKKIRIIGCSEGRQIYYPYWIGYYKRGHGYDFVAIDGVSGEMQGVRMKPVLISLLLQIAKTTGLDSSQLLSE
jgi:hypothetical protein